MKNIKENIRKCIYNINIRKLAVYTIYIILYSLSYVQNGLHRVLIR